MKGKAIVLFMLIALLTLSVEALAVSHKAMYIYQNLNSADQTKISIIQSLGYTVDTVRDTALASTNISKYDFFIVNDNSLSSPQSVPVGVIPGIIMNYNYVDTWHLAGSTYQVSSTQQLKGTVKTVDHYIVAGLPTEFPIYTTCCANSINLPAYYLSRRNLAMKLGRILSNNNLDNGDAIIATAVPGDVLKDGFISNAKIVFFGIARSDYWTSNSRTMFERSIQWLVLDDSFPSITNINISSTFESANISFTTDDLTNVSVRYGTTLALTQQKTGSSGANSHKIQLTNLLPLQTYYVNITACNNAALCTTVGPFTFATDPRPVPFPPQNVQINVDVPSNNIILSWTTPVNNPPIDHYNIYVADQKDGFSFNSPSFQVTASPFTDLFANLHGQRWYVVRSVDTNGAEEKNTDVLGKYDLHLVAGANFVALPLSSNKSITDLMHQSASYAPVQNILRWDSGSFQNAKFTVGSGWTSPFNTLDTGRGYIFNSTQEVSFTITGLPPAANNSMSLQSGMNLVGLNILQGKPIGDIFSNPDITEISRRSGTSFQIATRRDSGFSSVEGFTTLSPGEGYWVKAKNAVILVY